MKSLYVYHFVAEETVCADVPRASLFRTFSTLYESLLILKMMDYILCWLVVVLLLLLLLQRCILQKFQKLCERLYIYYIYVSIVSED